MYRDETEVNGARPGENLRLRLQGIEEEDISAGGWALGEEAVWPLGMWGACCLGPRTGCQQVHVCAGRLSAGLNEAAACRLPTCSPLPAALLVSVLQALWCAAVSTRCRQSRSLRRRCGLMSPRIARCSLWAEHLSQAQSAPACGQMLHPVTLAQRLPLLRLTCSSSGWRPPRCSPGTLPACAPPSRRPLVCSAPPCYRRWSSWSCWTTSRC